MSPSSDPAIGDEQPDGPPSPGWQRAETLGITEVVVAILRARKALPLATAAAISRERHGEAFHVRVRLMNDPPGPDGTGTGGPGAVIAEFFTHQLETDLADAFGGDDVFILK
jgi:hypothetical protein